MKAAVFVSNKYKDCIFYYTFIMNDELDPNSWDYLITEAIGVYINCVINVNIFTFLIVYPCTFLDTLFYGYLMTLFMYTMKWLTGVQKLV